MEDREAQDEEPDYIVSIEFDPFLNAQDTCEPFKAGNVAIVGEVYRVDVFCAAAFGKGKEPLVIAAVRRQKDAWVFVDFYYPGHGDLFSALEMAKKEREKPTKK